MQTSLISKKLDRVRQWAGEKMGAEAKTAVSDEFRELEVEMTLRHEGRLWLRIKLFSRVRPKINDNIQVWISSISQ